MKLTINHVTKKYGNITALSDFSAALTPGVYALLGPNGSGKSTLMNIIAGNLTADAGDITYQEDADQPENILKMGVLFREKLGFMPQYPGLYPYFSIEKFMMYIAALKGMKKKEATEQISNILDKVELSDIKKRRIKTLSGGMKQRLALAQAVLGSPEILILDEPTAGLDPKQRIAIRNFISEISFNKIVLIATHIVSDIEFIAKNVILLKKGVIVDNAPPAELLKKHKNRVWKVTCAEPEIQEMQRKYRVTNIGRDEQSGKAVLRLISEEKPFENAVSVPPDLEDYYLYVFEDGLT